MSRKISFPQLFVSMSAKHVKIFNSKHDFQLKARKAMGILRCPRKM